MTIVLEKYTSACNAISDRTIHATIEREKDYKSFVLCITVPYKDGSGKAHVLMNKPYASKKTARQAMKRYASDWKREELK